MTAKTTHAKNYGSREGRTFCRRLVKPAAMAKSNKDATCSQCQRARAALWD
jgi:hypothetical protein